MLTRHQVSLVLDVGAQYRSMRPLAPRRRFLGPDRDLWIPMIQRRTALGFELWSLVPGFADERTGRLLQCDGILFRAANGSER